MLIVGFGIVRVATSKGFDRKGHEIGFADINRGGWLCYGSRNGMVVTDYIDSAAHEIGKGLARTSNWTTVVRSTVPPTSTTQCLTPMRPLPLCP